MVKQICNLPARHRNAQITNLRHAAGREPVSLSTGVATIPARFAALAPFVEKAQREINESARNERADDDLLDERRHWNPSSRPP
jgi:hypothetical protein